MSDWTFHPPAPRTRIIFPDDFPKIKTCPRCGLPKLPKEMGGHTCLFDLTPPAFSPAPWKAKPDEEVPEVKRIREIGRAAREEIDRVARQSGLYPRY